MLERGLKLKLPYKIKQAVVRPVINKFRIELPQLALRMHKQLAIEIQGSPIPTPHLNQPRPKSEPHLRLPPPIRSRHHQNHQTINKALPN